MVTMNWICICMFCLLIISVLSDSQKRTNERTFIIDYEKNEFLKDGQVFRYVSGSLHYFRVPQQYWKDRIQKYKAAGLNAITTYVEWSLHEPYPGIYNFEGIADLEYFLKLIKDENMYLLLRPGPYICAERDFGGFPYWLLNVTPKNSLRTNNLSYTKYVSKWFSVLMPKIKPYLYGNGGNIIMVQVENEYGSYYACDSEYKLWLRDLFRSYVENKAVLYTTDGCGQSFVDCGSIPEVYATVDFGTYSNASECFNFTKKVQNGGPLVNSEFYPGWLTHWQEPLAVVPSNEVVNQVKIMLAMNVSFNFYMFHGGTNFGFTSGANTNDTKDSVGYLAQLTSYDYNAPLDEAGDPTEKYFKIKHALKEVNHVGTNYISPTPAPKGDYGKFNLQPLVSMFEKVAQRIKPVVSMVPLPFEDMDINTGFVIYETSLENIQLNYTNPIILNVTTVRDRAIIYLDQLQVGTMTRLKGNTTISLNINYPVKTLSILVENQGRINFGDFLEDRKGISGTVFLGDQVLRPWKMIAYPLNETAWLSSIEPSKNVKLPAFYKTQFMLPENATCLDTYLDTSGWTKGVAFLNEINLGRYWPIGGPQVTLYVPATFLKPPPSINTLVMLELENAPQDLTVEFIDYPILDGPISKPRSSDFQLSEITMHIRFEKNANTKCDSDILSLSWMGRVPDNVNEEGWTLDGHYYYKQGWLATGNSQGLVGVTFTSIPINCTPSTDKLPLRTNYNLRNHHAKVVLVKWNEPYQKLASCDSSGVINVWAKFDFRWNVELINDRNTRVTYFSWSHDGRLALICYQDGFVLVGSVTGHRYWSSMLHPEGTVTCGAWSPDDQEVYFGTSRGQMKVLDIHGTLIFQINLSDDSGISSMAWSCEKFCMNENRNKSNCLFKHVLAICCKNGSILLMRRYDDPAPILIRTGLCPIYMEWANSKELLCVAGSKPGRLSVNIVQIYSDNGQLIYSIRMPQSLTDVTAVTWAHNDRRILIATGPEIHVACVSASVLPLHILCALRLYDESLFPPDKLIPICIQDILSAISSSTIYCEVPKLSELRQFVSSSPKNRLYCTVVQHVNGPDTTPPVCYVLYMEYLGGLVPLLKGKRISMLKPEFVIFDPQVDDMTYANAQITYSNFGWDDSEPETCSSPKLHRKNRHKSRPACCNRKLQLNCYTDVLPEDYRLAEVTANVWGTKFHIRGLCDDLTKKLGRVSYRTSILHLQPRQMTLSIVGDGQSLDDDSLTPKHLQRRRSCSVGSSNPKIAVSRVVEDSKVSETFAHSLPTSPVAAKKKSGSPSAIRKRLMNSPLFFRKVLRTQIEPDFQNLETFQKSQIKNKIDMCTKRQQFVMQNKAPIWNDLTQVYQLDFGGRVTQESAKNFQVEYDGIQVMQFGRIDRNNFALDFQYPFSAVQAFAVALASVTQRLK